MPALGGGGPSPRAGRERRARAGAGAPRPWRAGVGARLPRRLRGAFAERLPGHRGRRRERSWSSVRTGRAHHHPRRLRRRRHLLDGDPRADPARAGGATSTPTSPIARRAMACSSTTVAMLAARGTRLLITVDCAITAVEEVRAARELGMDVVVTDHHTPRADGALPAAPIVHPAICSYPCPELCATAVAYKLAQALREASGADAASLVRLTRDLDLVALATVADVVPLQGENRALLRRGLRALAATAKPGLRALMACRGCRRGAARRAGDRLRPGAAAERRRAALPRRCRPGAAAHRGSRSRRADRARARRGELRAPPDRAAHPLRGRSADGRAGSARGATCWRERAGTRA